MKRCPNCDATMEKRVEARPYHEAGLAHVLLQDVEVWHCLSCGRKVVGLPKIEQLHRLLAAIFVVALRRLQPTEIKFLRKYTGMSSEDFAQRLHVTDEAVCAWEAGRMPMPLWCELQLRHLALAGPSVRHYAFEVPASLWPPMHPKRGRAPRVTFRPERQRWAHGMHV